MSLFRSPSARSRRGGAEPSLLVGTDNRAARAVRALDELFAAAPADELRAWARLAPRLDGRPGRARRWLQGGVLAAASVVGASVLVLWPGRTAVDSQAELHASARVIVRLRRRRRGRRRTRMSRPVSGPRQRQSRRARPSSPGRPGAPLTRRARHLLPGNEPGLPAARGRDAGAGEPVRRAARGRPSAGGARGRLPGPRRRPVRGSRPAAVA